MAKAIISKKIKMLLSIVIPMLIVVVTIIMVSTSFAWFTQVNEATVQTIHMTSQEAFVLSFTSSGDSNERNINYKGQTAIMPTGGVGRLATEYNGRNGGLSGSNLEQYLLDSPYYFITTIALDTDGTSVDMNMMLDYAKITGSSGNDINIYDGEADAADIPYAFTWFFKEKPDGETVKNFEYKTPGDEESAVMASCVPQEGEVWYTPYGKLTFDSNRLASAVNGVSVGSDYSILADSAVKDVTLTAENKQFDFYIVFAPQKLFWSQFFAADRDKSLDEIYTTEAERKKIFGETSQNQMYYSNMTYFGAKFEFGALIKVTAIHGQTASEQ